MAAGPAATCQHRSTRETATAGAMVSKSHFERGGGAAVYAPLLFFRLASLVLRHSAAHHEHSLQYSELLCGAL